MGRGPSGGASSSGAPPRVKYTDRPWRQFTSERCARLELIQDPTEGRMRPVLDLDPAIVAAAAVAVLCLETHAFQARQASGALSGWIGALVHEAAAIHPDARGRGQRTHQSSKRPRGVTGWTGFGPAGSGSIAD